MLDAKIVRDEVTLKKLARSPRFHSVKAVAENLVIVYLVKQKVFYFKFFFLSLFSCIIHVTFSGLHDPSLCSWFYVSKKIFILPIIYYTLFSIHRILEMAKYSMFDTFYNYLLPNFENLEMILTDVSFFIYSEK